MDELPLSILNALLAVLVAAGLLARHRVGASVVFFGYAATAVCVRVPVWVAPDSFYTWQYWAVTGLAQALLGAAVAAEFVARAFSSLGRARRRAWCAQAAVGLVIITLAAARVHTGVNGDHTFYDIAQEGCTLLYGRGWLFAAFLVVARYHRVPLDPFHRDVAAGFLVWSLVAGLGQQLAPFDGVVGICRQVVASLLYPGVLVAWAVAAWRADQPTRLRPANLALLRPWRVAA